MHGVEGSDINVHFTCAWTTQHLYKSLGICIKIGHTNIFHPPFYQYEWKIGCNVNCVFFSASYTFWKTRLQTDIMEKLNHSVREKIIWECLWGYSLVHRPYCSSFVQVPGMYKWTSQLGCPPGHPSLLHFKQD